MPLYSHLFILNYKKKGLKHNILSFLNNLCWFIRFFYGLNYVPPPPPQIHILKSFISNVSGEFGDRAYKEVRKVK